MAKKNVFFDRFGDVSDVAHEFKIDEQDLEGCKFIVAAYSYEDYSGSAYCLFEKDGKLFEVSGSHCSCNGLEDQWEPYEMTAEAIQHIVENGCYYMDHNPEMREALQKWLKKQKV